MRVALRVAVLAAAIGWSAPSSAQLISKVLGRDPDQPTHVDAYVGVDYTMVGQQNQGYGTRGLSLSPYVLKTADVTVSNLSRFDFGLNAAATSLLALGGFTQPADTSSSVDTTQAERYAALVGYALGTHLRIRADATFARLATYVAPNFKAGSSYDQTTYYVPSSGAPQRLAPGGGVGGNTDWSTLQMSIESDAPFLSWLSGAAIGYEYVQFDTISPYDASYTFQALVQNSMACHALTAQAQKNDGRLLFDDISFTGELHALAGYAQVNNGFVDQGQGMCFGYGANMAIQWDIGWLSMGIGVLFSEIYVFELAGGSNLASALPYSSTLNGRAYVAPAGSQWNMVGPTPQHITALSPFMHFTVHF